MTRLITPDLIVRRVRHGRSWSIELYGELDMSSVPDLVRDLEAVEALGPEQIVVDLTALKFIDSSGLHALVDAQRRADIARHELTLVRGPHPVQRLFDLSGCGKLFRFVG